MGGNKIGSFINNMTFEADLNVNGRTIYILTLTHSLRNTLVKKVKSANQGKRAIIGETCNRSARSLADYEAGGESKH